MFAHTTTSLGSPGLGEDWRPGPYPGVELKLVNKDESTGGVVVLRKFLAGTIVPAHVHPAANEHVYVLSGIWREDGISYGPGAYFYAPKGTCHGPHQAEGEVISLTIFDGPLTVIPAPTSNSEATGSGSSASA